MSGQKISAIKIVLLSLVNFVANFLIFVWCYNHLATPYLHEEQRVENADFIMTGTTSLFALVSIAVGIGIYFLARKKQ